MRSAISGPACTRRLSSAVLLLPSSDGADRRLDLHGRITRRDTVAVEDARGRVLAFFGAVLKPAPGD